MKRYFFIFSFVFLCVSSFGQSWLWAKQGTTNSDLTGVAADTKGNVYISSTYFDSISFKGVHLITTSGGNSYIIKFDSLGNIVWSTQPKVPGFSTYFVYSSSAAASIYDEIYIAGQFAGSCSFGTHNLTTGGAFLTKYDANGNAIWAAQSKNGGVTTSAGCAYAVATDPSGNAYITGLFEDTLMFGAFKVANTVAGNNNVFLAKYDSGGNVLWAKQAILLYSSSTAIGNSVYADKFNNSYITGYFTGSVVFGSDTLKAINNNSAYDVFLVKYDAAGVVLWAKQGKIPSSACNSMGWSVIADNADNVYLTGYFRDTISFGSVTLTDYFSKTGIYGDIFLLKYDASGNLLWAKQSNNTSTSSTWGWSGQCLAKDNADDLFMTVGGFHAGGGTLTFSNTTFTYNANAPDPSVLMEIDTSGKILCSYYNSSGGDDPSILAADPIGKYVYWGGDFRDSTVLGKDTLCLYPNTVEYPFVARWQPCQSTVDTSTTPPAPKPIEPCQGLFIPDAFSPNNDGQNDVLYVRGACINTMDFVIFDRWGEKVFESENQGTGWDGTYKGEPENTGTYVYYLKATLNDGTVVDKKGSVTLVR